MKEHYNTKATAEQQGARLVSVASRWSLYPKGPSRQQTLDVIYHAGDTTDSPIIGPLAQIYREMPEPKVRMCHSQH